MSPTVTPGKLTAVGRASYGEHVFSPTMKTTGFSFTPQYSQDGRAIAYTIVSITIQDTFYVSNNTDEAMNLVRRRLEKPGQEFVYDDKGVGDFSINTGRVKDVVWGPRPKMLKWAPKGGGLSCEITWQVEVAIPDHCTNAAYEFKLMEVNYTVAWQIVHARTKRTINGFLRIPNNRVHPLSNRTKDSADLYRDKVEKAFPVPPGFHRLEAQNYTLSDDRSKLTFQLTDEELPSRNVPPVGAMEAKVSHAVETGNVWGGQWIGRFSGRYRYPKHLNAADAYFEFLRLVRHRLQIGQLLGVPPADHARGKSSVLVKTLRLEEPDIFGEPEASFSLTYMLLTTTNSILRASGLWTPVPNSDYRRWATSMAPVFRSRGYAKLGFGAGEAIIDLCEQPSTLVAVRAGALPRQRAGILDNVDFPPPNAETSWLHFESSISVEPIDETVEMKSLPLREIDASTDRVTLRPRRLDTPDDIVGVDPTRNKVGVIETYETPADLGTIETQTRALPTIAVRLVGRALRAGFPIVAPVLESVGGVKAVQANREGNGFSHGVVAVWPGGLPIVGARWDLRWLLQGIPKGVGFPGVPYTD